METVTIDLSATDIDPPEGELPLEWCVEAEYFTAVTDKFDPDAIREGLEDNPLVIDWWVDVKDDVEFSDLEEDAVYRIKINCWMPSGMAGKTAARAAFAHFGEWIKSSGEVLGQSAEGAQPVGTREAEMDCEVEFVSN